MRSSADLHVGDFDFGEILPVPTVPAVTVTTREPEDPDLLVLAVPDDFSRDRRAVQPGSTGLHVLAVARDEDLVEGDFIPRLRVEQRHLDGDTRFGAELLAAAHKYRVTHRRGTLTGIGTLVKPTRRSRNTVRPPPCSLTAPRQATAYCSVTS